MLGYWLGESWSIAELQAYNNSLITLFGTIIVIILLCILSTLRRAYPKQKKVKATKEYRSSTDMYEECEQHRSYEEEL